MSFLSGLGSLGKGAEALGMLQSLDQDGMGVSESDFVALASRLGLGDAGETAARTAFGQVDANGNGKIDLKEAVNAFKQVQSLMNMAKE